MYVTPKQYHNVESNASRHDICNAGKTAKYSAAYKKTVTDKK
jgi:hypothetical protein